MRLTKIQIIEETVKYYTEDVSRRSFNMWFEHENCLYNGPGNTHCAVGRCLLYKYKKQGSNLQENENSINCLYEAITGNDVDDNIDKILSPKYRGHNVMFWSDLQTLHDDEDFWDNKGLTYAGEEYVNHLKLTYRYEKN